LAVQQIGRHITGLAGILGPCRIHRRKRGKQHQSQQSLETGLHTAPPAISALPTVLFVFDAPLSAECLYHEINHAIPHMIRIPQMLISACSAAPPDISASTKCPAKARKTPRQNISSECWPHRINGRSQRDFSPDQSRGRKHTVIAASARKCAKRSTSRFG